MNPDAVWVVTRATGAYSDYLETPVAAFLDEATANELIALGNERAYDEEMEKRRRYVADHDARYGNFEWSDERLAWADIDWLADEAEDKEVRQTCRRMLGGKRASGDPRRIREWLVAATVEPPEKVSPDVSYTAYRLDIAHSADPELLR